MLLSSNPGTDILPSQVSKLVFTIKESNWWIEVPIVPRAAQLEHALTAPRWLCSVDPPRFVPIRREDHTTVKVRWRNHRIQVAISHDGPAYIGEEFPLEINITNEDARELAVVLDVRLQPTEIDEAGASYVKNSLRLWLTGRYVCA